MNSAMRRVIVVGIAGLWAGCSPGGNSGVPYMSGNAPLRWVTDTGAGKIQHVVFIVQENRSFDNLKAPKNREFFLQQPPDTRPPDYE